MIVALLICVVVIVWLVWAWQKSCRDSLEVYKHLNAMLRAQTLEVSERRRLMKLHGTPQPDDVFWKRYADAQRHGPVA